MFADSKNSSEYIQSLQRVVSISYRSLTEDEVTMEEKVGTKCYIFI